MTTQFERDLYCLRCAGYTIVRDFVPEREVDELARLAQAFELEVEDFVRRGGKTILRHLWPLRTTRALYAIHPMFQDLAMHPMIQAFARGYLEQPRLRDCLLQTNMPDARNGQRGAEGDVSYHRDSLWSSDSLTPMYLHCFVLLTDFNRDNGATIIVAGTHRQREPGYYFKHTDPRAPQPGIDYRVYERSYFSNSVQIEARRGALLLLDPMSIHTQGINTTDQPRVGLNITFRTASGQGLLNARSLAQKHARVPVRADLLEILDADPALPDHFGPLGNSI
jgi:ectoine hydroxylase-related dioxygenase (phytanoyl-CoA dioxygenase family)